MNDDALKKLHDRATRGETLSPEERTSLDQWYALQDQAEGAVLKSVRPDDSLPALQLRVETTLNQIVSMTKRIQEIVSENEGLKQEIGSLRRQLLDRTMPQPA